MLITPVNLNLTGTRLNKTAFKSNVHFGKVEERQSTSGGQGFSTEFNNEHINPVLAKDKEGLEKFGNDTLKEIENLENSTQASYGIDLYKDEIKLKTLQLQVTHYKLNKEKLTEPESEQYSWVKSGIIKSEIENGKKSGEEELTALEKRVQQILIKTKNINDFTCISYNEGDAYYTDVWVKEGGIWGIGNTENLAFSIIDGEYKSGS